MEQELVAGDSLNFLTFGGNYPASSGWTLVYVLTPRTAGNPPITITATAEGSDFRVAVAASVTANWVPDQYSWRARVEKAGEKYTVESGQILIKQDLAILSAGFDGRTLAEKALDDAKAAFASFAASGGAKRRYKIGHREMEFTSSADIIERINFWTLEVKRERRQVALAKGLPDPSRAYVRLNRG